MKTLSAKFLLTVASVTAFVFSFSQKTPLDGQGTPAEAAYKHISNLNPDNYNPAISAQTIYGKNEDEGIQLAEQLKKIMDAYGLSVDTNLISSDSNYIDSASKKNIYYPYAELKDIYLQKKDGSWYYSSQTADQIPVIYLKVFPKGSNTIASFLKKLGSGTFLGLEQWQWWGILFTLLSSVAMYYITRYPIRWIINTLVNKRIVHSSKSEKTIRSSAKFFSFFIAVRIIRTLYPLLLLPITVNSKILMFTNIVQAVFLGFFLHRFIAIVALIAEKIAARTASTLDDQVVPLLRKLIQALIIIATFLVVLGIAGVNLTALLAGISIGGLALAFAAQDSVKNIFGSLMLLLDRSFQIGDQISIPSIDGIEGKVEEIGLRSTRIRTSDNSIVSIPNARLADAAVNNLGMRIFRRYRFNLAIAYDTDPKKIEQFVYGIKQLLLSQDTIKKDTIEVHFYAMDASTLTIRCNCHITTQTSAVELSTRETLNLGILQLANLIGIGFGATNVTFYEKLSDRPVPIDLPDSGNSSRYPHIDAFIGSLAPKQDK